MTLKHKTILRDSPSKDKILRNESEANLEPFNPSNSIQKRQLIPRHPSRSPLKQTRKIKKVSSSLAPIVTNRKTVLAESKKSQN